MLQVELKTNPDTPDSGSVQKAADFVQAFILGRLRPAQTLLLQMLSVCHVLPAFQHAFTGSMCLKCSASRSAPSAAGNVV